MGEGVLNEGGEVESVGKEGKERKRKKKDLEKIII